MELAIPLIALGGMYVISNQQMNENTIPKKAYQEKNNNIPKGKKTEQFTNMGKPVNYLPNTNTPPQNYPIMNNTELTDTVQQYVNPNTATDKYFNQNLYEQRERNNKNV